MNSIDTSRRAFLRYLASSPLLGATPGAFGQFDYTVSDSRGATADSMVSVTVTGINDAPIARGQLPDQSASDGNQVSINTAVCTVMWSEPITFAPDSGLASRWRSRARHGDSPARRTR